MNDLCEIVSQYSRLTQKNPDFDIPDPFFVIYVNFLGVGEMRIYWSILFGLT